VKREHPLSLWGRGRGAGVVGVRWAMTSFDEETSIPGVGETGRRLVMRIPQHQIHPLLLLRCMDQLQDHEHNNYVVR
jgi:hypothetical protein